MCCVESPSSIVRLLFYDLRLALQIRLRPFLQLAVRATPGLPYVSHNRKRGPKQRDQGQYRNAEKDAHGSLSE
jgi:hypothetical protein